MTNDMSVGKPGKVLMAFTLPMLLGNLFQQLYNMVDSIVVGNYEGADALAAVGTAFPIMMLVLCVVIGLTNGFSVVISQYFGAGQTEQVRKAVYTSFVFMLVVAIVLSIVGVAITYPLLWLLQTPESVLYDCANYLIIIFAGLVFTFLYNIFAAILRALGDSKTPLYMLVLSTVVNIVLDILFVASFGWGVPGVAIATIIAQAVSAFACFFYTMKRVPMLRFHGSKKGLYDKAILKTMIGYGLPSALQQSIVSIGMLLIQGLVNSFGSTVMAAYTSGNKIDNFATIPMMTMNMALSTYTAQNMGAGKPERVREGYRFSIKFTIVFCLALTGIIALCGSFLVGLFVDSVANAEVIRIGTEFLDVACLFYFVFGLMQNSFGVLRGAGDMKFFMVCTFMNLGSRVASAYLLAPLIGYHAIWWSMPISWGVAAILSTARYLSGKWKDKAVVNQAALEAASMDL